MWCAPLRVERCHRCAVVPHPPGVPGQYVRPCQVWPRTYDCVVANEAPTAVYLDDADSTLYYLAFDFLLARAPVHGPIRDGVAVIGTWTVVDRMTSDEGADAYRAIIRSELLRTLVGSSWQSEIDLERAKADELVQEGGPSKPPGLDSGRIATVVIRVDSQ